MAFAYSQLASGVSFLASERSAAERSYDPVYSTELDASLLWGLLPSYFSTIMDDRDNFEALWESLMAYTPDPLLRLWQYDYGKSIRDVPVRLQVKWVEFDFVQDEDFAVDPTGGWTFVGSGDSKMTYDADVDELYVAVANRAGVDRAAVLLNRSGVDQNASLSWSVTLIPQSADKNGGVLFGYGDSTNKTAVQNFLGFMLAGDPNTADNPIPVLLHLDAQGLPTSTFLPISLVTGIVYRIDGSYSASDGTALLTVYSLAATKLESVNGEIGEGPTTEDIYTDTLTDESVDFEALEVSVGDTLEIISTGETWTIATVSTTSVTVTVGTLPINNTGLAYRIYGERAEASGQINLPADATDPTFSVDSWTVSSLDLANAGSSGDLVNLTLANRRRMEVSVQTWSYLDPSVAEDLLSVPFLQDNILEPDTELEEGTDFQIVDSVFLFLEPPTTSMWAEYAAYNNEALEANFGTNIGITGTSNEDYRGRVAGLYYAYFKGPTPNAIRTGVQITLGLPISIEAGEVEAINPSYSGTVGSITIGGRDYFYPLRVGTPLVVGDVVEAYRPLSYGVDYLDIYGDPTWWVPVSGLNEVNKYHTFAVRLDIDAFDIDNLSLAASFVSTIKPTWKNFLFLPTKSIFDAVDVDDELDIAVTLALHDSICGIPTVAYDIADFEGDELDWAFDQGLTEWTTVTAAMRGLSTAMTGTAELTDGSRTLTGTSSLFTSEIGSGVQGTSLTTGTAGGTDGGGTVFTDAGAGFSSVSGIEYDGAGTAPENIVGHYFIEVNGEWGKVQTFDTDTQCTFEDAVTGSLSGESWTLYKATAFMAFGLQVTGIDLVTTAGSHIVTDATTDAFADVETGDFIQVTGEGTFEVQAKVDNNTLNLEAPMTASATTVTWQVDRKATTWAVVVNVASDTSATLGTSVPVGGGLGGEDFVLSLLDGDYLIIAYDNQEEICPEEDLEFTAELSHFWSGTKVQGTYEMDTADDQVVGDDTEFTIDVDGVYHCVYYSDGKAREISSVDSDTDITLNANNTSVVAAGTPAFFWAWVSGNSDVTWVSDAASPSVLTSSTDYDATSEVSVDDWLGFAPHSTPSSYPIAQVTAIDYNVTTANRTVITLDRQVTGVLAKKIVNLGDLPDPFGTGAFPAPYNDGSYADVTWDVPEPTA